MEPELAEHIYELDRCIECGCCVAGCGTARMRDDFVGAVGLNKIARFRLDPRDTRSDEAFYELVGDDDGVFGCMSLLGCHDVCPKRLPLQTQIAFVRRKMAAMGCMLPLPNIASAQAPLVIKFSHVVASDTPKGKASEFFAKRAAELTGGKVKVEVYANSTLYKDKEEMEALQIGAVQMLAPSLAKFGPLGVREFELFDLPFIFDNDAELHKVTTGPVGKMLFERLEGKGIKGLAYWDNGFKSFSANKPLKTPDDFKGLKMRIQSSKVLEAQMRAVGALPQVMAFSEVYQALQTGVVDGTENPHSNLYTQKMHEVQKHMTLTEHGYLGYAVITNKKFWDGLPADVRGALEKAMAEASIYANRIAKEENDGALEKIKASGKTQVYVPTAAERMALKKAMLKVHRDMESRIGAGVIAEVYKETAFDPAKL
jgi:C4-dicarboxylate-binding protein DctP